MFSSYFDTTEIAVISGGPDVGAAFSALPLDHIIFTGAGEVGKRVMQAAAQQLASVTLELGGKSPVIVSRSARLGEAAEKIITGKAMNAGQVCISPDYCFVPEEQLEAFVKHCQNGIASQYPTVVDNDDFVSVINERHYDRLRGYIDDAQEKGARIVILAAAEEQWDERARHRMPIHLVIDPAEDSQVMQKNSLALFFVSAPTGSWRTVLPTLIVVLVPSPSTILAETRTSSASWSFVPRRAA